MGEPTALSDAGKEGGEGTATRRAGGSSPEDCPGLCIQLFLPVSLTLFVFAVLPSFTKIPHDIAIRTGTTARLECAATGHPNPQIAWQKDGGTDFPAARERRMHVMPDDDVFFITNVKIEDMGVYSCTAQNSAGTVSANATLTVFGPSARTLSIFRACAEGAGAPPLRVVGCD